MSAIDVGTTQLTVSGTHAQPNFVGSNRTWRSESRNFKRTSHEASSGRQRTRASSEAANVAGAASKIINVLAAMADAQKFSPVALSPTAGQSPFGSWRAINGSKSSFVGAKPDGDECRASNANDVASVPNCAPQWLHPPVHGSRRMRSSAKSRRCANCCLSNATNEQLMFLAWPLIAFYRRTDDEPKGAGVWIWRVDKPRLAEDARELPGAPYDVIAFCRIAKLGVVFACSRDGIPKSI
jgi:hypothetical protein